MSEPETITTADLVAMLRSKHTGPDWAFVDQVPNGTGMKKSRTCDGLAMSLWPSKGMYLHGFEVKVSRGDWLTEIQDLTKADAFSRYCHFWWIVAPTGIVKLEELPTDWGLMCPTRKGNLRAKKAAAKSEPQLPDHGFLAGLFRACGRASVSQRELQAARRDGWRSGIDTAKRSATSRVNEDARQDKRRIADLERRIREFESASGVNIDVYRADRLGELVAAVKSLNPDLLVNRLHEMARQFGKLSTTARTAADVLKENGFVKRSDNP